MYVNTSGRKKRCSHVCYYYKVIYGGGILQHRIRELGKCRMYVEPFWISIKVWLYTVYKLILYI